jgi:hypothetical protein
LEALPQPGDLLSLAKALQDDAWQWIEWREGTHGPQKSSFALFKVWAVHGWRAQNHPARVAEWLLIEWPEKEEAPTKYWLAWFDQHSPGMR